MKILLFISVAATAVGSLSASPFIGVDVGPGDPSLTFPEHIITPIDIGNQSFVDFYNYDKPGVFGGPAEYMKDNTITSFFLESDVEDGLAYVVIYDDLANMGSGEGGSHRMILSSSQELQFLVEDDPSDPRPDEFYDLVSFPDGLFDYNYDVNQGWSYAEKRGIARNDGLVFGNGDVPWSLSHGIKNASGLTSWRVLNGDLSSEIDLGFAVSSVDGDITTFDYYANFIIASDVSVVPEPSLIGLMGISGLGLIVVFRRFHARRKLA